jgi:Na+-transporting NADH:ubiquinone oxidoreductase subunit NqrF
MPSVAAPPQMMKEIEVQEMVDEAYEHKSGEKQEWTRGPWGASYTKMDDVTTIVIFYQADASKSRFPREAHIRKDKCGEV